MYNVQLSRCGFCCFFTNTIELQTYWCLIEQQCIILNIHCMVKIVLLIMKFVSKAGDQILDVNGQSFLNITHKQAVKVLKSTKNMIVTLKDIGRLPFTRVTHDKTNWITRSAKNGQIQRLVALFNNTPAILLFLLLCYLIWTENKITSFWLGCPIVAGNKICTHLCCFLLKLKATVESLT